MDLYMPEIYWFDDRKAITSVDIQQIPFPTNRIREFEYKCDRYYKLVTVSVTSEVRIWDFCYETVAGMKVKPLKVDFVANLDGHQGAINCCKFSPNGQYLSTGDAFGGLITWFVCENSAPPEPNADYELPPNKENWKQYRKGSVRHGSDVTCLAWSPCSQFLASGSNDDSIIVQDIVNGKVLYTLRSFRRFPVGICWDPRGKFIASFSTDRRLDIIDAKKGHRLRNAFAVEGLKVDVNGLGTSPEVPYKLFHDDQLVCFARTIDFSPCGSLLFVPTAHIELPGHNVYGTYVFKRGEFDKLRPSILLPSNKATILARSCPVVYSLSDDTTENFMGLPFRVVFAVMTIDAITVYDSQHQAPFMYVDNMHYDNLTSLSWTPDGKSLVVSSLEGYNTFIMVYNEKIGQAIALPEDLSGRDSPVLKKPRNKPVKEVIDSATQKKADEEVEVGENKLKTPTKRKRKSEAGKAASQKKKSTKKEEEGSTPKRSNPSTPKSAAKSTPSLLNFFTPTGQKKVEQEASPVSSKMVMASKTKKKVEIVCLEVDDE